MMPILNMGSKSGKMDLDLPKSPGFVWQGPYKQTHFDLTLVLLGICSQESSTAIQKSVSIKMFRAALFKIAIVTEVLTCPWDVLLHSSQASARQEITQAVFSGWVHLNLCQ